MLRSVDYRGTTFEDKSGLLKYLLQRFMIHQATFERSKPAFFWHLLGEIIRQWLHMLSLLGEFPGIVQGGSLPIWFKENYRNIVFSDVGYAVTLVQRARYIFDKIKGTAVADGHGGNA